MLHLILFSFIVTHIGLNNNQWVDNGRDTATSCECIRCGCDNTSALIHSHPQRCFYISVGPSFDNAYHDFLVNDIVANDIPTFAQTTGTDPFVNVAPFSLVFPNWFFDGASPLPDDLIHLDTDITLAFAPEAPAAHPDFSIKTNEYAGSNDQFLMEFFLALHKMSKLGVTTPLSPATECEPCDLGAGKSNVLCITTNFNTTCINSPIFFRTRHHPYYYSHQEPW